MEERLRKRASLISNLEFFLELSYYHRLHHDDLSLPGYVFWHVGEEVGTFNVDTPGCN